jgi:hypothetical protein
MLGFTKVRRVWMEGFLLGGAKQWRARWQHPTAVEAAERLAAKRNLMVGG